jgi:hypothetical protein
VSNMEVIMHQGAWASAVAAPLPPLYPVFRDEPRHTDGDDQAHRSQLRQSGSEGAPATLAELAH